jgi:hypothetical protein
MGVGNLFEKVVFSEEISAKNDVDDRTPLKTVHHLFLQHREKNNCIIFIY